MRSKTISPRRSIDYTLADKAKVIALLVQGLSVPEASKVTGIKATTIHHWNKTDEAFQELLSQAEETAIAAVIEDGVEHVRMRIKELGPKALDVLREALDSDDERTRLSAARDVFKIGGIMSNEISVRVGLERLLGGVDASPVQGD